MSLMVEMRDTSLAGVSHKWSPASDECRAYGTLRFGTSVRGVTVYLDTPAEVDEVIAELVALKQEMAPPEHTCECGHFEAYHVGAVLGDKHPGQCTAKVDGYGYDDCGCERYRPAAGGKDEPASPDAAEALIDAIVAGTPVRTVSA